MYIYILWRRYRAEILGILFNSKHFGGVVYSRHFALYVFKVKLVLKLQRETKKKHKSVVKDVHERETDWMHKETQSTTLMPDVI